MRFTHCVGNVVRQDHRRVCDRLDTRVEVLDSEVIVPGLADNAPWTLPDVADLGDAWSSSDPRYPHELANTYGVLLAHLTIVVACLTLLLAHDRRSCCCLRLFELCLQLLVPLRQLSDALDELGTQQVAR